MSLQHKIISLVRMMAISGFVLALGVSTVTAQDRLPADNGLSFSYYHSAPAWRESEGHPLRIFAYALHPVGWVAREVIFRPLSYFASSSDVTRSVMGYRDPFDYRNPSCFSGDVSTPDCRSVAPFNYDALPAVVDDSMPMEMETAALRQVYFPDVNFDFDKRKLNDLGTGRARQIAQLLEQEPGLRIVLEGHTDFIGSESYNEKLGLDRAEAVRQELMGLGIASDRVSTVTFGKTKPVFTEEADWARAVNRRVQIQLDDGAMVQ